MILAAFVSCKNNEEPDLGVANIAANTKSVSFTKEAGKQTVKILASRDWEAKISSTEGEVDWLTVSPVNGKASADSVSVDITVLANSGVDRYATVTFDAGAVTASVSVSQAGEMQKQYNSIADVRALYQGENVSVSEDWTICGTVVSNYRHSGSGGLNNATSMKTVIIQDETAGISLYLVENNTEYAVGDRLEVKIQGLTLQRFQGGSLQIDAVPMDRVNKLTSGQPVEAKAISAADLLTGEYESQYVAVADVQVVDADLGKTFVIGDSHTSINMISKTGERFVIFSSKYATYGGETVPEGSGTLRGIAAVYGSSSTYQISVTSTDDYAGLTGERFDTSEIPVNGKVVGDYNTWNAVGPLASFSDDFSSVTDSYEEYRNDNWMFYTSDGTSVNTGFKTNIFDADKYIDIAPYQSTAEQVVAYALPPRADMTKADPKQFSFRKALYYKTEDDSKLEVVVSSDFAGDFEKATWTVVKDCTFPSGSALNEWTEETVDLSSYSSQTSLAIAIRYTGKANTYRIDDVAFGNGDNQGGGDEPDVPVDPTLTVATIDEFLAAEVNDNVWYQLTGTITNIADSYWGNITIQDETGSVYVYGLTKTKVDKNDNSFSSIGLKEGDIVTLAGTRDEYNDEAQVGGPAYYISHEEGELPENPALIAGTQGDGIYTSSVDLTQPSVNSNDAKWYNYKFNIGGNDYPAIKLGTGSVSGAYSFNLGKTGSCTLTMYAIAWNGKKTHAKVEISGGGTINGMSYVELDCQANSGLAGSDTTLPITFGANDFYTMSIEGATETTVITVTTDGMANERIGFTGVNVK